MPSTGRSCMGSPNRRCGTSCSAWRSGFGRSRRRGTTPAPLRPAHRRWDHEGVTTAPPLRVMLVDDHEVVRNGIRALLQATDDIVVTAEAGSVRDAIDEAE